MRRYRKWRLQAFFKGPGLAAQQIVSRGHSIPLLHWKSRCTHLKQLVAARIANSQRLVNAQKQTSNVPQSASAVLALFLYRYKPCLMILYTKISVQPALQAVRSSISLRRVSLPFPSFPRPAAKMRAKNLGPRAERERSTTESGTSFDTT